MDRFPERAQSRTSVYRGSIASGDQSPWDERKQFSGRSRAGCADAAVTLLAVARGRRWSEGVRVPSWAGPTECSCFLRGRPACTPSKRRTGEGILQPGVPDLPEPVRRVRVEAGSDSHTPGPNSHANTAGRDESDCTLAPHPGMLYHALLHAFNESAFLGPGTPIASSRYQNELRMRAAGGACRSRGASPGPEACSSKS